MRKYTLLKYSIKENTEKSKHTTLQSESLLLSRRTRPRISGTPSPPRPREEPEGRTSWAPPSITAAPWPHPRGPSPSRASAGAETRRVYPFKCQRGPHDVSLSVGKTRFFNLPLGARDERKGDIRDRFLYEQKLRPRWPMGRAEPRLPRALRAPTENEFWSFHGSAGHTRARALLTSRPAFLYRSDLPLPRRQPLRGAAHTAAVTKKRWKESPNRVHKQNRKRRLGCSVGRGSRPCRAVRGPRGARLLTPTGSPAHTRPPQIHTLGVPHWAAQTWNLPKRYNH